MQLIAKIQLKQFTTHFPYRNSLEISLHSLNPLDISFRHFSISTWFDVDSAPIDCCANHCYRNYLIHYDRRMCLFDDDDGDDVVQLFY